MWTNNILIVEVIIKMTKIKINHPLILILTIKIPGIISKKP